VKQNGVDHIPTGLTHLSNTDDESLLMAQSVPIPDDSDDEDDADVLSFSAAIQHISPQKNTTKSPASTLSPASDSRPSNSELNALSTAALDTDTTQQPVVEDALRARAEQAESAAERLLELVEPEDDLTNHPILPPSLLKTSNGHKTLATKPKPKPAPLMHPVAPRTPDNRASMILKKAALFTDSPMIQSKQTSLLDVLRNSKQETGWWLKRKARMSHSISHWSIVLIIHSKYLLKHHPSGLLRLQREHTIFKTLLPLFKKMLLMLLLSNGLQSSA
jgi:CLIP-associating protein 1/2